MLLVDVLVVRVATIDVPPRFGVVLSRRVELAVFERVTEDSVDLLVEEDELKV